MKDVGRVIHFFLQSAIEVRKSLCTAAEPQGLAEVVAPFCAIAAVLAHDASFDGDSLSRNEIFDSGAHGRDDSRSFVAEDERSLQGKVAVPSMQEIVH